jgi:hypothetical protein
LAGGKIVDPDEGSGVGSGIFTRYAVSTGPPSAKSSSGSGRGISSAERDTKRIDQQGTGRSDVAEEIGLAPLDEEDVLDVSHRKSSATSAGAEDASNSDLATSSDVVVKGPGASKSLIEEELHDADLEVINRRVTQRAQFNPLQPPGYVPPSRGVPVGVWLLVGGIAVAAVAFVLWLVLSG